MLLSGMLRAMFLVAVLSGALRAEDEVQIVLRFAHYDLAGDNQKQFDAFEEGRRKLADDESVSDYVYKFSKVLDNSKEPVRFDYRYVENVKFGDVVEIKDERKDAIGFVYKFRLLLSVKPRRAEDYSVDVSVEITYPEGCGRISSNYVVIVPAGAPGGIYLGNPPLRIPGGRRFQHRPGVAIVSVMVLDDVPAK